MGYCIKLKSYKEIKENDIDMIVYHLPDYLRGPLDHVKKQEWGWPCICDIHKPKDRELIISGSISISGDRAKEFTYYIQKELDKLGYDVQIQYSDDIQYNICELNIDEEKDDSSFVKIKQNKNTREVKNMRVMISQPMNGRRNDDIKKEREEIIERFKRLHIDVIDSLIEDTADPKTYNEYHPALYYLARSIELMGQVDAVYFVDGWREARGCRIERRIAEEYNVKILESSFIYPEKNRGFDINKLTITPCKEDRILKPDYQITCVQTKEEMLNNKTMI